MPKPKSIQDTPADAQKIRRKSGIDKRVSAVETNTNDRITNLRYTDFLGVIPSRAYDIGSIPDSALVGMGASKLQGTLPSRLYGDDTIPNKAVIGIGGDRVVGTDVMSGVVVRFNSMHGNRLADGTVSGSKLSTNSVGGREISSSLRGGVQSEERMRRIGGFWGGNSFSAAANDHGHSVSFKELPLTMRQKITTARTNLHENMIPAAEMPSEDLTGLANRVWLLERLLASVLHLELDDPYRPTSVREGKIAGGNHHDVSLSRYPGGEQEYRGYHPEASALFDSFDVSEIAV